MTLFSVLFYVIAALLLASTAMAVTRSHMVHAVLYLVLSFFGSAILFFLLGAPFLAALEIIIYAGAIMVLFLFIIMMIRVKRDRRLEFPPKQTIPALVIGTGFLVAFLLLLGHQDDGWQPMQAAQAPPGEFGRYLFQSHWLAVEIAALLLLVAIIGAGLLGRRVLGRHDAPEETR